MSDAAPFGAGTVLAGRFRLEDLLDDHQGARFWRATDQILARSVAVHVLPDSDPRAPSMLTAARTSALVTDAHLLRVLDAAEEDGVVYVVNEWGSGISLDRLLAEGLLSPRRAAWVVKEVAEAISTAHRNGVAHGRLLPENVLVTEAGSVKLVGFVVDAVLRGRDHRRVTGGDPVSAHEADVLNLGGLLYACLTGRWPGTEGSTLPDAPAEHHRPLRPRRVRAGVPRPLDAICDRVLDAEAHEAHSMPIMTAHEIYAALSDYIGDPAGAAPGLVEPTTMFEHDAELAGLAGLGGSSGGPLPGLADLATGGAGGPDTETRGWSLADSAGTPGSPGSADDDGPATVLHPPPRRDADEDAAASAGADTDVDTGIDTGIDTGELEATGAMPLAGLHDDPAHSDDPDDQPDDQDDDPDEEPTVAVRPDRTPSARDGDPEATQAVAPLVGAAGSAWAPARERDDHQNRDSGSFLGGFVGTGGTGGSNGRSGARSTGPGNGPVPSHWGPAGPDEEDSGARRAAWGKPGVDEVPGKSWMRLAAAIAGVVVLVLGIVFAFDLGRGDDPAEPGADSSPSADASSSAPAAQRIKVADVTDFDPQGDPPEENPDLAPLAVDGKPGTAWQTLTYRGNPQLGGLKSGVGLLLDLGEPREVGSVRLSLLGEGTSVDLLAAPEDQSDAPTGTDGLEKVATVQDAGTRANLRLEQSTTTRWLVVWLTKVPAVPGGFQGKVAEISVRS